jgi:hypothetical protein
MRFSPVKGRHASHGRARGGGVGAAFVRRTPTLLIAVPLAAITGLSMLGVLALVCAAGIAAAQGDAPAGDALSNLIPGSWPGRRRRK